MLNSTSAYVGPTLRVKSDWWPGKSHTGFHRQSFEMNPISALRVNARKLVDQSDIRKRHKFGSVWPKVNQAFWSLMMNVSAKFEVNNHSTLSRNMSKSQNCDRQTKGQMSENIDGWTGPLKLCWQGTKFNSDWHVFEYGIQNVIQALVPSECHLNALFWMKTYLQTNVLNFICCI